MHLKELKAKNPSDLLIYAESLDIENASTLRKARYDVCLFKEVSRK